MPKLSPRSWNSPTLHLEIADSRIHLCLRILLTGAGILALFLLSRSAYPWLAALLLPPTLVSLVLYDRDSLAGYVLIWGRDHWRLRQGEGVIDIELLPSSAALPWGIYLVWRETATGRRRSTWLFPDCAPPDGLRRLRVRLRLQG